MTSSEQSADPFSDPKYAELRALTPQALQNKVVYDEGVAKNASGSSRVGVKTSEGFLMLSHDDKGNVFFALDTDNNPENGYEYRGFALANQQLRMRCDGGRYIGASPSAYGGVIRDIVSRLLTASPRPTPVGGVENTVSAKYSPTPAQLADLGYLAQTIRLAAGQPAASPVV